MLAVDGCRSTVRAGEIVGIAGVEGNGQTELVEALAGCVRTSGGRRPARRRDVTEATPRQTASTRASAHIPEDRHKHGLVLGSLAGRQPGAARFERAAVRARLAPDLRGDRSVRDAGWSREFDIRARSVARQAATLSGGNQQKAVVAREFLAPAAPAGRRAADARRRRRRDRVHPPPVSRRATPGQRVLLVSAELDEVLAWPDRIAVMYRGRIAGLTRPT